MNKGVECTPLKSFRDYVGIQKERLHRDGIRKVLVHGHTNVDNMTIAVFSLDRSFEIYPAPISPPILLNWTPNFFLLSNLRTETGRRKIK